MPKVILYPYADQVEAPSFIGTDKIEPHGYFRMYLQLAAAIGPQGRVCEIGVMHGESLRMWQMLFPMGEITGVDYDQNATWPPGTIRVVKSQDDPSLAELGSFDLIVDDASHEGLLTRETFNIMWPQVKPGGYYVIEDWNVGLPGVGNQYDPEMLNTAASLLTLLPYRDGECDSVLFRYGLAIVHKQ